MGLDNIVEGELMEIIFTNIQLWPQVFFSRVAKINCHRSTETQKHRKKCLVSYYFKR